MREILSLQVGQCGNQIGKRFWEVISQEHGINPCGQYVGDNDEQTARAGVYYTESVSGRYVPRNTMIDLEPGTLDHIRGSEYGSLYCPDTFIFGHTGAGNNWAKGYHSDGKILSDLVMDCTRKQAEMCDCLQGYQLCHSLGGGTGSGLGSLLVTRLREENPDRQILSVSIYPSPKVSDTVVEPYNCVLTTHRLIENVSQVLTLDNEALYDICCDTLDLEIPCYADLNYLASLVMNGVTSSLRYPGLLNIDLRKIAVNMIPFPRLHFFSCGFAPLTSKRSEDYRTLSVADLTKQVFDQKNMMAAIDSRKGVYMASTAIYRGNMCTKEIDQETLRIQNQFSNIFIDWVPNNVTSSVVSVPHHGFTRSVTFLGNTTSICHMFERVGEQFNTMFFKSAFLHWYLDMGMEDVEFTEAEANMNDLAAEYMTWAKSGDEH